MHRTTLRLSPGRTFCTTTIPRFDNTTIRTPVNPQVKPFYVTTPIFYVNAAPHIGHLHSLLLTDILARYSRLRKPEREVRFATGTDEHGLKIQQVARERGKDPKVFCDDISERFRELARKADSSHTDFIRTTDPAHHRAVQHLWRRLQRSGQIYKGKHSGWYAISDECFYPDSQVVDQIDPITGVVRKVAMESGSVVEWTEEENYKFRLSGQRGNLIRWLEDEESVHPQSTRLNLLTHLKEEPLEDLSISRPRARLSWGIPVPGDPGHTIYVWVDALVNYLTVLGFPWSERGGQGQQGEQGEADEPGGLSEGRERGWPVDAHVVGKDIVRFHAIYWPALLIAAGLPPPRKIIAHAHWTMNKSKMSKSRGNVANPIEAMEKYGVDGVRWYLMRIGGALAGDADYSSLELDKNYKLLASQLGNLVSRISSRKLQARFIQAASTHDAEETSLVLPECLQLRKGLLRVHDALGDRVDGLEISQGLGEVMDLVFEANRVFTALEPWKSDTSDHNLISAIVFAHEALRLTGIALTPVMPGKMGVLLDTLSVPQDKRRWEDLIWDEEGALGRVVQAVRMSSEGKGKKEVLFPPIVEEV